MVLQGTIEDLNLSHILGMLWSAHSTGRVEVHGDAGRGQVFLRGGEPYFAQSSHCRSLIGQKLLQAGAITEQQLLEALDRQVETKERLGRALMSLGLVTPEQVKDAVVEQIKEALADLLEWDQGEFTWESGIEIELELQVPHLDAPKPLSPNHRAPSGFLEGTEATRLPSATPLVEPAPFAAPPDDAIVVLSPLSPDTVDFFDITNEQWRVARFANGRSNIAQIASDVGPTPEEGRRLIHEMLAEGILAVLDDSEFSEYRHVWDARSDDVASGASEEAEIAPAPPEATDSGATAEEDLADSPPIMARLAPPSPPGRPPANLGPHQHVKLDRSMLARELSGLFKNGRPSVSR